MRETYVVTREGRPAIAFESRDDALVVAKKLYPHKTAALYVDSVPYVASDSETDSEVSEIDSEPVF